MKLFGKRRQPTASQEAQADPINSYAVTPLPRQGGPPASSTPLADALAAGGPGLTDGYVVVPRALAENMPLPWQQRFVQLIGEFNDVYGGMSWPQYRVLPSRRERLVDLDEEQLAEVGYVVELDAEGSLVYRERNGRKVSDPENTVVLVTCLDPVTRRAPDSEPDEPPQPQQPHPAQMNIGPQPVWEVVPPATANDTQQDAARDEPQGGVPHGTSVAAAADPPASADAEPADLDTPPKGFAAPVAADPEIADTPPRGFALPTDHSVASATAPSATPADEPGTSGSPAAQPAERESPADVWQPPEPAQPPEPTAVETAWPTTEADSMPAERESPADVWQPPGPVTPQEPTADRVDWFGDESREPPHAATEMPFTELPPAPEPQPPAPEQPAHELDQKPPSFGPTGDPIERPWRPR